MFGRKELKDDPHFHLCAVCLFCQNFKTWHQCKELEFCSIPLSADACSDCPKMHSERCAAFLSLTDNKG